MAAMQRLQIAAVIAGLVRNTLQFERFYTNPKNFRQQKKHIIISFCLHLAFCRVVFPNQIYWGVGSNYIPLKTSRVFKFFPGG